MRIRFIGRPRRYRQVGLNLLEQAALIERVEASLCGFTSLFPLTNQRQTARRPLSPDNDITEVRIPLTRFSTEDFVPI
jgi:hypothetical protein